MKNEIANLDVFLVKVMDLITYIICGQFPEKVMPLELSDQSPEMKNISEPTLPISRTNWDRSRPQSEQSHFASPTSSEALVQVGTKMEPNVLMPVSDFPKRIERKHLYSPRKIRSRYTNIQRNRLLLSEGSPLSPEKICTYLSEARVSDLLNIPGFSPELVARIYDTRRQKKFSSVKEIEERVEGFLGSHLSELQIAITNQRQ